MHRLEFLLNTNQSSPDIIDSLSGISKLLSDYGPLIVILSVFILVFLGLFVFVLKKYSKSENRSDLRSDEDRKVVNTLIQEALDNRKEASAEQMNTIIEEFRKNTQLINERIDKMENDMTHSHEAEDDYHKDIVGAYMNMSMALKDASRHVMNDLKCERIGIYVFHNGNSSIHGLPFFKMTCIHEWTITGKNTIRGKYHVDTPLQVFNDFIEDLYKYGYYRSGDVEQAIKEDPSLEEFIGYSHTKSIYIIAIKDSEDRLAGFIVSEFIETKDFNDDKQVKEIHDILDKMREEVTPIVTEYLKNEWYKKNKDL